MGREALVVAQTFEPGSPVRGEYPQSYQTGQKINAWKTDQARQNAKHIEKFNMVHRSRDLGQDAELSCVCPGIFIGSWGAARNLVGLKAAGVTHIINASPLVPCFHSDEFSYMVVDVRDDIDQDLSSHFPATNAFIEEAILKGGVLLHCYAGISRSAALAMAYLISVRRLEFIKALKLVKRARPGADPNLGFRSQLQALQEACQQDLAEMCVTIGKEAHEISSDHSVAKS